MPISKAHHNSAVAQPRLRNGGRVAKFGGSSLASLDQVRRAARTMAEAASGQPTIVVVSARGAATDELLAEAYALSDRPKARELDQLLLTGETASAALLAMALQDLGCPAVSLSGPQAGVRVRGPHTAGRIEAIPGERIGAVLRSGQVAVVAGFHGVNEAGDIVTLGRGGSDTSAVAIAAAIGAPSVDIYTDVDGVFTADPRVVPSARLIPVVDSAVMAELAFAGAKVLHSRSVHLAGRFGLDIHVRNSVHNSQGTIVRANRNGESMLEIDEPLVGIAHTTGVARVVVQGTGPGGGPAIGFLAELAARAIPVDVISSMDDRTGGGLLGFTVAAEHVGLVRALGSRLGSKLKVTPGLAKASFVGTGLLDRPEYTGRALGCLERAGIRVHSVAVSQLRVTLTLESEYSAEAIQLLHEEFSFELSLRQGGDRRIPLIDMESPTEPVPL